MGSNLAGTSNPPARHTRGCIFCRRHDGRFTAREHTLPESLGNDKIILPPGVVCDRCNHGPLADPEQELITFAPVGFLRILLGHTNKKGERPVVRWNNATVSSRAENHMFVDAENEDAWKIVGQEGPHTHFNFNFTTGGPVSDARWRKIARALWKTTLELAYLDHGEMVYEQRFNEVCAMVAGTNQASGFLLFPKDSGPPNSEVSVTYQFQEVLGQPAMNSATVIAGVPFITDLFLRRLDPVDRVILGWRYNIVEF